MAHQIPITEPAKARAGSTWQWRRVDLSDYPASTWALTYYFRNASSSFEVVANADADAFSIDVPPATSAAYVPGVYNWYAKVTDGVEQYDVDSGELEVEHDITQAAPYDGRSHARILLDAVRAILENRASTDQIDLLVSATGNHSITRDPDELRKWESVYSQQVKAENGKSPLVNIWTRFSNE